MDHDVHAAIHHKENLYYPFASKAEFDLGYWLLEGALSQKEVDLFLHLKHTKNNLPSFNTSKDLRARIEGLFEVPRWYHQQIKVSSYKTKAPLMLYWRDGLDVVKHLFANPFLAPCMDFQPYREFKGPDSHLFIGMIGALDKTPLTIRTGNKEMHPILISLTNIHAGVRMKATSHAFALVTYLPIPKFLDVSRPIHTILSMWVYHFTISIVMRNLKLATHNGCPMSDPRGDLHMIHTPLVAWIANYPEQLVCTISDPCNIAPFHKTCQTLHLNGVVELYWKDWDGLHQWHKFYFYHIINWSINIMGGAELDRRLSALQPHVGVCHWVNGVSTLKQLTGQEHRDLEKLLPGVVVGAVSNEVVCALRAITEFIFQAQNLFVYDKTLHFLSEALHEFHHYKDFILINGPLNHFQIPKLELMQHVTRSTRAMGAPYQWSSDITECCHITHVKQPYRMTNRRDFHVLKLQCTSLIYEMSREANTMALHYPKATWISTVLPDEQYVSTGKSITSLFTNNHTHFSSDDTVAILLTCQASQCFHIPDLCPALGDLISGRSYIEHNGRRICGKKNCSLSFDYIHIWQKFHMQQHSTQDSCIISPARTRILGHLIVQVKAIIQPVTETPRLNQPFLYVEFFNFSHLSFSTINNIHFVTPAPVTDIFQFNTVIELIPKFGQEAPLSMNCTNSLQLVRKFYVNNFADKETFHTILSYQ
ncbi:hypothetical protein F4604DRAFT_1884447 [Suillus subluteus]|nr:hypothetical protein F4604DRAFT_1884447 [Suillus subluteus]